MSLSGASDWQLGKRVKSLDTFLRFCSAGGTQTETWQRYTDADILAPNKWCASADDFSIPSLPPLADSSTNAQSLLDIARGQGSIENSNHYVRDRSSDEDRCPVRDPNSAQILATRPAFVGPFPGPRGEFTPPAERPSTDLPPAFHRYCQAHRQQAIHWLSGRAPATLRAQGLTWHGLPRSPRRSYPLKRGHLKFPPSRHPRLLPIATPNTSPDHCVLSYPPSHRQPLKSRMTQPSRTSGPTSVRASSPRFWARPSKTVRLPSGFTRRTTGTSTTSGFHSIPKTPGSNASPISAGPPWTDGRARSKWA